MRLTDVDNLIDSIYADMNDDMDAYTNHDLVEKIIKKIDTAPIADAEPVRNAHWKYGNDGYGNEHYYCSLCHNDALNDDDGEYCLSHRCPHCGAKMDEEANNETDK